MNRRLIVILIAIAAVAVFAAGAYLYQGRQPPPAPAVASVTTSSVFLRPHTPIIGPLDASVTIVEFFDPSCEACRAFYEPVKQIMARYPNEVRLAIRYTPFHKGSDEAVRILEAARLQNLFVPVLEALLETQPVWARHSAPNLEKAWEAAGAAGLDLAKARQDAQRPEITTILQQDVADLQALNVRGTPTFFVNEKPLPSFGTQQLYDLVRSEVARTGQAGR